MTWPVENIIRILRLPKEDAKGAGNAKASAERVPGRATAATQSLAAELLARHLRLLTYVATTCLAYWYTFPIERAHTWAPGWVAEVVLRNFLVELVFYQGWHWVLFGPIGRARLAAKKFNPVAQYDTHIEGGAGDAHGIPHGGHGAHGGHGHSHGQAGLMADQLSRERVLTTLGFVMSSAFECVMLHLWATGRVLRPYYLDFWATPVWSLVHLLVIPYWRDAHFYFVHRFMHPWRFTVCGVDPGRVIYRHVHSLHHKSHNPGPWSGLSMHPLEHLLYYTCVLLPPLFFSLHPAHMLFNKFHADVSPVAGHDGYGNPGGGSLFHYLHHAHFECNYGTPMVPLDRLFGTYEDGTRWQPAEAVPHGPPLAPPRQRVRGATSSRAS